MVNKLLYGDGFVLMTETMEDLKEILWNWKDSQEPKRLKVNIRKKVMVSGPKVNCSKAR